MEPQRISVEEVKRRLDTGEAVAFLERFFARHKGKYELSLAEAAEPVGAVKL